MEKTNSRGETEYSVKGRSRREKTCCSNIVVSKRRCPNDFASSSPRYKHAACGTFQKPSFIKGDIDIDPKKCQGFFSRGSITYKASKVPGEPSRLSVEYDEEMSKLIQKIVKKKSKFDFVCLKRSVGFAEEHVRYPVILFSIA